MDDPALELAKLLNDTPELQRRLNDYVKAKTDADTATEKLAQKKSELDGTRALLDKHAAAQASEIAAATAKHDAAANEAGLRMQGAREHEARLNKRETELNAKDQNLQQRESTLHQVQSKVKEALDQLASLVG